MTTKEEFENMKTTELIDLLDKAEDIEYDALYDVVSGREFYRYLQEQITENTTQLTNLSEELKKGIESHAERLDKIDNLWNIQNKLEIIIDKLRNPSSRTHRKKV